MILGRSDLLPRSKDEKTKNIAIEDFRWQIHDVFPFCDKCVYKDGINLKVIKYKDQAKDINILNQLRPIFNTDEKIESIAFWMRELDDGTIFIHDEDECECIYINNEPLSYYFDKKTSVAADTAKNMQELFSDNKDHFENQDNKDLENILYALVKKYTDLSENQDIVLAIRGFDFQALDMQVFTNYYGKRAFSRAGTIMFTIKRNGEIETREENYY